MSHMSLSYVKGRIVRWSTKLLFVAQSHEKNCQFHSLLVLQAVTVNIFYKFLINCRADHLSLAEWTETVPSLLTTADLQKSSFLESLEQFCARASSMSEQTTRKLQEQCATHAKAVMDAVATSVSECLPAIWDTSLQEFHNRLMSNTDAFRAVVGSPADEFLPDPGSQLANEPFWARLTESLPPIDQFAAIAKMAPLLDKEEMLPDLEKSFQLHSLQASVGRFHHQVLVSNLTAASPEFAAETLKDLCSTVDLTAKDMKTYFDGGKVDGEFQEIVKKYVTKHVVGVLFKLIEDLPGFWAFLLAGVKHGPRAHWSPLFCLPPTKKDQLNLSLTTGCSIQHH